MRSVKGMLTSPLVGLAMVLVTVPLAPGFAAPSTPGSARGHHAKVKLTTQQGQWDLAGPVAFSYQEPELKHAGRKVRTEFSAAFATC